MSRLRFRISMSLDGFVAGPGQSVDDPLGIGGTPLHEWVVPLAVWRATHGLQGGEVNESTRVVEESLANIGASVMGRNMFGGHPGPWDAEKPWNGWWGVNPPFHHPVCVLTHYAREVGDDARDLEVGILQRLQRRRQRYRRGGLLRMVRLPVRGQLSARGHDHRV